MRKIKNKSGFTLAETMVAVLILMFVGVIVAEGMPAARNAYNKVVLGSNAQVLLSTTVNALRDELSTSLEIKNVSTTNNKALTYYNSETGSMSKLYLNEDNVIMVQDYVKTDLLLDNKVSDARPLLSAAAKSDDLNVTYKSVSYDPSTHNVTFEELKVFIGDNVLVKQDPLVIHVISTGDNKIMASAPTAAAV